MSELSGLFPGCCTQPALGIVCMGYQYLNVTGTYLFQ